MKNALKVVQGLAELTSKNRTNLIIAKRGDKITYINIETHFLLQIIYIVLFTTPFILLYFQGNELDAFTTVILLTCSMVIFLSCVKGSFQTSNTIEIDLATEEIKIIRNGFLSKLVLKDRIVKIQKNNKIIVESVPFSTSLDQRITLKNDEIKIPLLDLKNDSNLDQIFLSLKLLAKGD